MDHAVALTYLDHAATTPMRPEAIDAMLPFLRDRYGNPSGAHALARDARAALDEARDVVAAALGCEPGEVVFTSGGTEGDATAIASTDGVVVCSAIEHHAVLEPVLARKGRVVPVRTDGVVDLDALIERLDDDVTLVSVHLVNNEIGTVQPLGEIADIVRTHASSAALHTDAVQALPWVDVATLAADAGLVTVSGHKVGGPKGVGALVVRADGPFRPLLVGGGQERDRRGGTHNVAGIVALAEAVRVTVAERDETVARVGALRDRLVDGLLAAVPDCFESGDRARKVAGNGHVCFDGIESEALLFLLERDGVLASAAASCASGAQDPSHVLAAIGIPRERARGSLRLSLGYETAAADVDLALAVIPPAVAHLREVGS